MTARIVVACFIVGAAWATTYRALPMDALIDSAQIAFYGEVRDVTVFEREGRPWTRVVFDVERDLMAEASAEQGTGAEDGGGDSGRDSGDSDDTETGVQGDGSSVELAFLGGSLPGGPSLAVALMPAFEVGERVLVFAYLSDTASPLVGFRQGLWRSDGDALRDEDGQLLGIQEGMVVAGAPAASIGAILDVLANRFAELP